MDWYDMYNLCWCIRVEVLSILYSVEWLRLFVTDSFELDFDLLGCSVKYA